MTMHDGVHQPRQYSLTKADDGQHRQFAVKRVHGLETPDGEMSTLLHNEVQVGDEVVLSAPFGDVVLEYTDRPLVLASAGIGITPMAGMLSHLVKSGSQRQVMLLHADDSEASFPLRGQVREDLAALADGTLKTWFLNPTDSPARRNRVRIRVLRLHGRQCRGTPRRRRVLPLRSPAVPEVGPERLMAGGVPAKDIQYEVFGPDLWLADFQ